MRIAVRCFAYALVLSAAIAMSAAEPDFRAWIKSPEAYFATNAEIDAWHKSVVSKADADKFIAEYWNRRGAAFRTSVLTRIERADELFALSGTPGSRTPKGRVWILLGSPTREQNARGNTIEGTAALPGTIPNAFQNNSIERGAHVSTKWTYQKERLPAELGVPELVVNFQTNQQRGQQTIENPGLIEPYLKRIAEFYVGKALATSPAAAAPVAAATAVAAAPMADDPLWAAPESLGGAFFDAESYIAPNENPFYAVNFYLPKAVSAFKDIPSVLMVGLVKNAAGQQVAAIREELPLRPYGATGDRYVDRSFALPPGQYAGSFALFTPEGTTMLANRRVDFTVQAPTETAVSQLLPTAVIVEGDKQLPLDPFTFVATKYAVKGDRRFSAKDKVGFFTVVSNPAGDAQPSMVMTMKISKNGQVLHRTPPEPAPLTQTGPHTWLVGPAFDPGTFDAGQYTIEIQLKDLKAPKEANGSVKTYVAKTDFTVE